MDYFALLDRRRSTRKFTDEPVSQDILSRILETAYRSPVGSGRYSDLHLTVVRARSILDDLSEAAVKRWEDKETVKKIVGSDSGADIGRRMTDPFYGAPVVVFVSHRRQDIQPGIEYANAACVAYTMHLAATDQGLGSVFIWFALESMREIPALDHTAALRLPEGFAPLLGLALGHPKQELGFRKTAPDRIAVDHGLPD